MINKRTSKITMLTALFVAGVVNAQEFYTCVPNRGWWMYTMGESIRNNVPSAYAIANAVANKIPKPAAPTPQPGWKLITMFGLSEQKIPLQPGTYKIDFCKTEVFHVSDDKYLTIERRSGKWSNKYFIIFVYGTDVNFTTKDGGCDSTTGALYKYE